jgi:eukaryotic-like serine/threonine-protein kinase
VPPATALKNKTCPRCGKSFDADATFCPNDGTKLELPETLDPDRDPYIGEVIHGDIEIKSVAGGGAMGKVYRAHQRGIDRDVAVKILHRELSGNLPLVQRFHREAKIASKLQHPHVVEVFLAGQLPDGALYIVMEYLDGLSLAAAIAAAGGLLPIERAIPITLQICDAVGEGHSRGIVHRDLKPENVMLVHRADTSDWVKVLDFGIAKVSLGEQSMETAAGLIFGTARYISPEGAQGATVGPSGDVYSIAVILYQLLCGRTPFDAEQPVGLLIKHIHETPPHVKSWPLGATIPDPVARVVMENLVKDPSRRAPSARAFGNAVAAAAKEANISFSDVGVVARMSMLDIAPRSRGIEPTLDDAHPPTSVQLRDAKLSPKSRVATAEALARTSAAEPPPKAFSSKPPPPDETTAPASEKPERKEKEARSTSTAPEHHRRSPLTIIILAFLLGVAITALVMQQLAHRKDVEHEQHIEKTRRALHEGRYTSPPGDNVRDLTAVGQKKWPDDLQFTQVRNEAAHELVTRAMAARSAGDLGEAHELVKTALDFDPSDHAAQILLDQYTDELRLTSMDGGSASRVLIDVPVGRARPGVSAQLSATILLRGVAPKAVENPHFTITGPGLAAPLVMPAETTGPGTFRAAFVPLREGSYTVIFEAAGDGRPFRAERSLDVSR